MDSTAALYEREVSVSDPLEGERTLYALAGGIGTRHDAGEAPVRSAIANLWGESEPMQKLFDMLERVAPTRANILLIGESGTGKEVIAERVHQRSRQAGKPLVAINCGAIPAGLIEAELFGHERGSFTGAVRSNKGVFERAADGTLFLDEVTEMPLELQAKLLRVLESGRFYRVGGDREIAANCRIIAATNRDPELAVQEGTLREDLLYRLAVFPLRLPALRERGRDLELLAERFLEELNREYRLNKRLSRSSLSYLHDYAWPGNVRELKNAIHRAYILADRDLELATSRLPVAATPGPDTHIAVTIGTSIADMERALIFATLSRCEGNKRQTARILGVSIKTLYNRLNDYDRFARSAS